MAPKVDAPFKHQTNKQTIFCQIKAQHRNLMTIHFKLLMSADINLDIKFLVCGYLIAADCLT